MVEWVVEGCRENHMGIWGERSQLQIYPGRIQKGRDCRRVNVLPIGRENQLH